MVFLLSWNVAGWTTTAERIRNNFPTLEAYFQHIGADIIALQEVKTKWENLRKLPVPTGAADPKGREQIPGWETFWAVSTNLRSFNGVATFAKKGLVHRANANPFESETLNNEGRCLVTYHSHFVLFNVYAVNGRHGERQEYKIEFLTALRKAMHAARQETNLPVILCGDLNITYRMEDAHWNNRRLLLDQLCWVVGERLDVPANLDSEEPPLILTNRAAAAEEEEQRLKEEAAQQDGDLLTKKSSSFVDMGKKSSSGTSPTNKNVAAPNKNGGEEVLLPFEIENENELTQEQLTQQEEYAKYYNMRRDRWEQEKLPTTTPAQKASARKLLLKLARHFKDTEEHKERLRDIKDPRDALTGRTAIDVIVGSIDKPAQMEGPQGVQQQQQHEEQRKAAEDVFIRDVFTKVVHAAKRNVSWIGLFTTSNFSDKSNADLFAVSKLVTEPPHCKYDRDWAREQLMADDGMVDTLPYLYPQVESMATCWDQSKNRRFENSGNRLDYFFLDASLVPHISRKPEHLQPNLEEDSIADLNDMGGERGVRRVTENFRYQPAPKENKVGLQPLPQEDCMLQFNRLPSSGLFLSPPQYSDHIGVTLMLETLALAQREDLAQKKLDATTLSCMHRGVQTTSIIDMFNKHRSTNSSSVATTSTSAKPTNRPAQGNSQRTTSSGTAQLQQQSNKSKAPTAVVVDVEDDDDVVEVSVDNTLPPKRPRMEQAAKSVSGQQALRPRGEVATRNSTAKKEDDYYDCVIVISDSD